MSEIECDKKDDDVKATMKDIELAIKLACVSSVHGVWISLSLKS